MVGLAAARTTAGRTPIQTNHSRAAVQVAQCVSVVVFVEANVDSSYDSDGGGGGLHARRGVGHSRCIFPGGVLSSGHAEGSVI